MTDQIDTRDRRLGYLFLTFAMITVGSAVIASKIIGKELQPFTATAIRFAFALPIFYALVLARRLAWPKLNKKDFSLLVLQACAGSVGYSALLISGLVLTSASDASVLIGTLPVAAALISIFVLRETPDRRLLLAIALATIGVLAVSWPRESVGSGALVGNVLILGAVLCEGLFALLNKRLSRPIAPLMLSTIIAIISFFAASFAALAFETPFVVMPTGTVIAALTYYAVVPTVLGFVLWYSGAARVSGSEASLFIAVAPVSAIAMAGFVLGEPLAFSHLAGILCVLLAIASATWRPTVTQGCESSSRPDSSSEQRS